MNAWQYEQFRGAMTAWELEKRQRRVVAGKGGQNQVRFDFFKNRTEPEIY